MTTPETKRDEDAVRRYVESLGLVMSQIGMQRMSARVFAALMTTDSGQLTAAELAEQLSVSPAAISGAVRYLDQIGLVRKVREPGERRDHYQLYDDLWYATFLKRDRFLIMWRDAATDGVDALGPDTPAGKRLAEMRDFLAFMLVEVNNLYDRWHELRKNRD
ncbi:MarR family transcriptional regulator [Amycolatopsis rubida]|uniref:MarR family protein n=1 Tax=Amycolatopsis rubida TaxID=112413 RepID=A0A1I5EB50_9PSEU|nr:MULTISPECIES: MarR family transcriptional regulator [Amycolatopsis]MYW97235.1 MarR family transcriptional regulator [Amycolatopsis rubida]NEC62220.1 MarR family transcriptional regulator [Amycolatopsis rubida]OAP24668.1 MarR family protein [Amycolatopsis sp. M39]SFO08759.1 MarR family protein [Amycolatopsis rubida]